jgi:hypothetical protein
VDSKPKEEAREATPPLAKAEAIVSPIQLLATVLPPAALPLAPQLLATTSTIAQPLPAVPPAEMVAPAAVPTTPTATRAKPSPSPAPASKQSPVTPKAPLSKTVTLRVNTDREDFKRFASMTRDKLRQVLFSLKYCAAPPLMLTTTSLLPKHFRS